MSRRQANCPNCGAALEPAYAHARMMDCAHCGVTVILDKEGLAVAGQRGEMFDAPGLLHIGRWLLVRNQRCTVVGHARFSYGRGWWDEYWCMPSRGSGIWVSTDEGDVAYEVPVEPAEAPRLRQARVGTEIHWGRHTFRAVETETASCVAVRGSLPEVLTIGETHQFTDFLSPDGHIMTLETWDNEVAWFQGAWLDPYELRVGNA